ncbi:MAG: M24 family metallopeptidase [Firmicutes bacterium]|nr:aminopeptidase P family protein [Alicyclobacillaceae bacterium]MCL6498354.1 M24 family metallopeptidase [Bacillota bacterium]
MTQDERLSALLHWMDNEGWTALVLLAGSAHSFIHPNPVVAVSGFRSVGPSAVLCRRDGTVTLWVSPAWELARARSNALAEQVVATDDVVAAMEPALRALGSQAIGLVGRESWTHREWERLKAISPPLQPLDDAFFAHMGVKTAEELAAAEVAAHIAEAGYQHLLQVLKPGMPEYQVAAALDRKMRELGAEDDFLLLSASQHNRAVRAPGRRVIERGDILLAEISPAYRGQFVQICRSVAVGRPQPAVQTAYACLARAFAAGRQAASPGRPVAEVADAINQVLAEAGYGDYCRPPYMRVRGHGLGFSGVWPGDITPDNATRLAPDALFVLHPNQYLPESGYLLCGEPVVVTPSGARSMTTPKTMLDAVATTA